MNFNIFSGGGGGAIQKSAPRAPKTLATPLLLATDVDSYRRSCSFVESSFATVKQFAILMEIHLDRLDLPDSIQVNIDGLEQPSGK